MKYKIAIILILALMLSIFILTYKLNNLSKKVYYNREFNIETYISSVDKDNDGIDDQTDFLNGVREYLKTNPKYKSKYYGTGYPDDEYGVCTDVVAFGLKYAGYDLMELVNEDIINNREKYNIDIIDKHIDFRRTGNLDIFLKNNCISLTTDLSKVEEWQGGDIIMFKNHVGIISEKRNKNGIPFLIHHMSPMQINYEEDVLESYDQDNIIGHYRIS